jgi:signal transduction histidine kinase
VTGARSPFRRTRFASAELEGAFRRSRLRADGRLAAVAYAILAVNLLLFAFTDRVLFGAAPIARALLALRAAGALATVGVLVAARRARTPGRLDALHLSLAVLYAGLMVVMDATRPRSFIFFLGPETALVFASWVFFSARFAYQAIAAMLFTAGIVLTLLVFRDPLPAPGYLAIAVGLAGPHVIGAIGSWYLQRARRMEWLRAEELAEAHRAAEVASRAKSLFLGMVSHEVLAPLGGIVDAVEALRSGAGDDPQGPALAAIEADAAALRDLLGDVLALERGEAVEPVVVQRPTAPAALLAEVERAVSALASGKGLRLECITGPEVPARVSLDPGRVRQVLLNLASNALRCTARGTVTLRCHARGNADGRVELTFDVHDTGPGIRDDDLPAVFEPFWQRPTAGAGPGRAGLGLAVAKLLAQRMGGRLEAASQPGAGSRFTLTLPQVEVVPAAVGEVRAAPAKPRPPLDPDLEAEAIALVQVPHAGRARALAERVEACARARGDVELARWAEELRAAADRVDAAELTAVLGRVARAAPAR